MSNLGFWSGSFDYPRASQLASAHPQRDYDDTALQAESSDPELHSFLGTGRVQSPLHYSRGTMPERGNGRSASSAGNRTRMRRVLSSLRHHTDSWPPERVTGTTSRPVGNPSGRWRPRMERNPWASTASRLQLSASEEIHELHEAGARLAQINEDLHVIENVIASLQDGDEPREEQASSGREESQRNSRKRRRLNDTYAPKRPRIEYGHHGQSVAGKLRMQIVSSDGGSADSPLRRPDGSYMPENVLIDDRSIYCTRGRQCNMVLRHQGETTFSLEKLVITAPGLGYHTALREGLVFVCMSKDELFHRTVDYRILHFPTCYFAKHYPVRSRRSSDAEVPLPDLGRSRALVENHGINEDGLTVTSNETDSEDEAFQVPLPAPMPPGTGTQRPWDNDEEEARRRAHEFFNDLRARQPTTALNTTAVHRADVASGDGDIAPRFMDRESQMAALESLAALRQRTLAIGPESGIADLQSPPEISHMSSLALDLNQYLPMPGSLELMTPVAKFTLCDGHTMGSSTTIKFDPPISGRYILLKIWDPRRDGTVELQNITAHGFAGLRWFPSVAYV